MRVLLVYPGNNELKSSRTAPLGVQILASCLRQENVDVKIINTAWTGWEAYKQMLNDFQPNFVGISIQTPIAKYGINAIRITREVLPSAKIIVGGSHTIVDTDSLLKEDVDFIVLGEGEKAIKKIVKGETKDRVVKGETIECLDDVPFPSRDLMPYETNLKHTHNMEMMVSRGCPYNCLFCQPVQRKLFGNKVKMYSVCKVIEEIKQIKSKYGNDFAYKFNDDTFTWNLKWLEEFCMEVKPLSIRWTCSTRVNEIDEHKLKIMRDTGCFMITYGVESGSQKILNFMRKGITIEQTKKAFRFTHKAGIAAGAYIIIGTPTETKEDLEMTVELIKEIHPDSMQVTIMTPMKGSDLETYCKEKNIINISSFNDYVCSETEYPIKLEYLTKEDLSYYKDKLKTTWSSANYKNYMKYLKILLTRPPIFFIMLKMRQSKSG
jgi:radical SAM superfamily enzyme YgiQ (UPF0313 family)